MRDIKVRMWSKIANKFFYNREAMLCLDQQNRFNDKDGTGHNHVGDGMVFEQYTGLKDSKRTKEFPEGQEIYDGDILKILNLEGYQDLFCTIEAGFEFEATVSFESFMWGVQDDEGIVYLEFFKLDDEGFKFEVIGNIHEG